MMDKELKNIDDLEGLLNEVKFFDIAGVDKVGVFGSFARGEQFNDIDLLVDRVSDYFKLAELKEDLEKKTGKKIDVILLNDINPIIFHRAKKDLKYVKKH